jgi:hypothetical protein
MKPWKKLVGISVVLGAIFAATTTSANTSIPGSVEDPLITKSYMDEEVAKIKAELNEQLKAELKAELKNELGGAPTGGSSSSGAELVVVKLETNQQLIAKAGTEVIVRTGQVIGTVSPAGDGIPDVTGGTDIKGTQIPHNHLLLFPRDDGRGIKVVKGPSYVMIRGSYEIK